jgi:hypothetical protein
MKTRHFAFAIILCVAGQCCLSPVFAQSVSDSSGCNNYSGYTDADSLFGIDWFALFQTIESDLSPDGRWLATNLRVINYPVWNTLYDGVVIIDRKTGRINRYINSMRPRWSPDGNLLLLGDCIYVPASDSVIAFPSPDPDCGFWEPEWSVDGKSILFSVACSGGKPFTPLLRFDITSRSTEKITFKHGAKPLTDSTMIFLPWYWQTDERYYLIYNIRTSITDTIYTHALDGTRNIYNESLSPGHRFVAADIQYDATHETEFHTGVGIFDLDNRRLKEVLQGQPFYSWYYPSWSSDSTLLISFICHSDSSYTTWEIDTNGVFLRKLTDKRTAYELTDARPVPELRSVNSVSIYPCPTKKDLFIECTLRRTDTYTLSIFDILGNEVCRIWSGDRYDAGRHKSVLSSSSLAPGVYLVRLAGTHELPVYTKLLKSE